MRRNRIVLALLAAGLVTSGCSQAGTEQTPAPTEAQPSSAAASDAQSANGTTAPADGAQSDEALNAAAAAAIATAEQGTGGTAYSIDDKDDDQTWEVELLAGGAFVEAKLSADGKTLSGQNPDDDDDDGRRVGEATVPLAQAIETALREVPGTLDDAELEQENGTLVWEVTIDTTDKDDIDVYVNAADGSIVRVDR